MRRFRRYVFALAGLLCGMEKTNGIPSTSAKILKSEIASKKSGAVPGHRAFPRYATNLKIQWTHR
jgi:hypothetical protein